MLQEDLVRPTLPELIWLPRLARCSGPARSGSAPLQETNPLLPAAFIDRPHAKLWVRAAVERFAAE